MKNNYLVLIGDNKRKKVSNVNFLFPLASFCVGIKKEYELEEIDDNSYIYVNRLLNCEDLNKLERILPEIEKKIKGIVFEDLGVLELLKEKNSKLETIFFATHAVCSSVTANAYLKEVDTLILSPDITKEETEEILMKSNKSVGVYTYGNLPYMYSRRTLLTNYQKEFQLKEEKEMIIKEPIKNQEFLCIENSYGTVLYNPVPIDARVFLKSPNIKYHFLNLEFTKVDNIEIWLNDFEVGKTLENTTKGFLEQKTIYRLPPRSELR